MIFRHRFNPKVWLSCPVLALAVACGSDAGDCGGTGGASCGGQSSGGSGGTGGIAGTSGAPATGGAGARTCGESTCEAGQHCFNGICVNGCLTDDDCNTNQSCQDIDTVTSIGACKDKPVVPTKDCQAFCSKALACQDPDAALCTQRCAGESAECVACVVSSNCGIGCDSLCGS
jgi:hypothetical protein